MKESELEKYVKDFVYKKTSERVELKLKDNVELAPCSRKGSINLSMLWVNVLQKNFPVKSSNYTKGFCKKTCQEMLILSFGHVKFYVYLRTGENI